MSLLEPTKSFQAAGGATAAKGPAGAPDRREVHLPAGRRVRLEIELEG
jgi:hypothetical protein